VYRSTQHALRVVSALLLFAQETGYSLSDDELNRAFLRFKELADKKKEISSLDLASIVNDEIRDLNIRRFELVGMQVRQSLGLLREQWQLMNGLLLCHCCCA